MFAGLNFSHGSQADHQEVLDTIRDINKKHNYNVGILADLQGPKITNWNGKRWWYSS